MSQARIRSIVLNPVVTVDGMVKAALIPDSGKNTNHELPGIHVRGALGPPRLAYASCFTRHNRSTSNLCRTVLVMMTHLSEKP